MAPEQDPGLRVPRQGAAAGVPSLAGDGAAVQDRGQPVGAVPGDEAAVRADAPDGAWDTGAVPGGARRHAVDRDGGRRLDFFRG